ncbi:hypothetical protein GC169_01365 [bacterium]|nr:hypothetical protein [bacterium]
MRHSLLLLASVAAVAAAGCAQSDKQLRYSAHDHLKAGARSVTTEMRLSSVGSTGDLSADDAESVALFASAYRAEGRGPAIISRPQGVDEAAARRAAGEARAILLANGVEQARIAEGPYVGTADAGIILSYETYEVVLPECSNMGAFDAASSKTNSALPSFGCAVATNIALMVSNPRDLVAMRAEDPADTTRRVIVMQKYRAGEPTAASRAKGASGAISSAID